MVLAEDLRQAVLQAALQGKLTEQLETDSNVDEMLKKIREKKNHLIINGDIKKSKSIKFVFNNEILFGIPDYWKWAILDDITTILGDGLHGTPQFDSAGDYYFINGNNLFNRNIVLKDETKKVSKEEYDKYKKELNNDTMMISINGTLGNIAFYNSEKVILGKSVCYFNVLENINKDYLFYFFLSFYFQQYIKENATGTTIKNVSLEVMRSTHIPIPPIEEQQRIVNKINEIMPKIDEYEKIEKELEALKKGFPSDMKDSLLQAAMQGKLTEQLENDSSVDELLEAIKKEKEELIAQKKIKKEKSLPDIDEEEIPFDIPDNWRWEKVGNICDCGAGATPIRSDRRFYEDGSIFWLKTGELTDGYIFHCEEKITQLALEKCSLRLNKEGDILIAMYGATIGKLGIVTFPLTTNQACCGCSPYKGIYNLYLFYYLMFAKKMLISKAEGGAQTNISREKIRNFLIPLPPIEEQQRIVERLDALLPLCEDLIGK